MSSAGIKKSEHSVKNMTQPPLLSIKAMKKYMNGDSGRPMIIAATAPWCGYCKRLYPVIHDLHNNLKGGSNTIVGLFNADKHSQELKSEKIGEDEVGLALSEVIQGYPTILYFNGKGKASVYTGAREADQIQNAFDHFVKESS